MGQFYEAIREQLSLYVRHSAWLNAVPEYKGETKHPPRIEQFEIDGIDVTMPECDAIYIASYLFEIGPVLSGGMGDAPLTHTEIEAWQRNTGIELESWEAKVLHRLSLEYLSESQKATKPDAPAPWADAPYLRLAAAKRVQRVILSMVKD